jgi:hypothetical protein
LGTPVGNQFAQTVCEADIDWIICIELNSNPQFRQWFGKEVFGFEPAKHHRAWRSISDQSLGESDLVWLVDDDDGQSHIALLENKIDAIAQPDQYERYVLRGQKYNEENRWRSFRIVLVSPSGYNSADSAKYHPVTYEALRDWFLARDGERPQYIASLFKAALDRPVYPPIPWIIAFREQVWKLANLEFPELGLNKPAPNREYWVTQRYDGFLIAYKMYRNVHKGFHRCVVDLELAGRAAEVEKLRAIYGTELLELSATVVEAGKSAVFRIEVPPADPQSFDEDATRVALTAWSRLLKWWSDTLRESTRSRPADTQGVGIY